MSMRAARTKPELLWRGKRILIFPDYARATQAKGERFRECKKALHTRNIKFALLYPAILRVEVNGAHKRFDDPKQAMSLEVLSGGGGPVILLGHYNRGLIL